MAFLFGTKKKEAPAPKVGDSIQALRNACGMLEKRQQYLSTQSAALLEEARACMKRKDKLGATHKLKLKKMKEQEIQQSYGKIQNLEMQVAALEQAVVGGQVMQAMKAGHHGIKAVMAEQKVEEMEELMDDITESMSEVTEASEAMARPIGQQFDESELEDELAALEAEVAGEQLQAPVTVPLQQQPQQVSVAAAVAASRVDNLLNSAPSAPVSRPVAAPIAKPASKADDELADLEASLA